ncbi:MAG: BamA/TamA family outer membrane protein [Parvularculaceae bacterium]|nr:BamA/TamA family outer membrane protein [Parvularculaceae bacterium]
MRFFTISAGIGALLTAAPARAAEDYEVRYVGAPTEVAGTLEKLTSLSLERRAFPTLASLRQAATADSDIIRRTMIAAGYFNPTIGFRISASDESARPVVEFTIDPGPLFVITRHQIVYNDSGKDRPASFDAAEIDVSDKADGASLKNNQLLFLDHLLGDGYPHARIVARRAEARLEDGVAAAVYEYESGPRATFNGVEVVGAVRTDQAFIKRMATWEDGEIFHRKALLEFRDELSKTGLFSSIEVVAGEVAADGTAPVRVTVEERKSRTIGAGVSYSTSEGPGARLFLEYRNIAGRGERARAEIEGTEVRQSFDLDINKPLPGFPGSAFTNLSFINDTTDAFNARSLEVGAGVAKRWLEDRFELRAGLALETSKVESLVRIAPGIIEERTYLVSAPLSATWNTEDDPLQLLNGARASLTLIPHIGTDQFTRIELVGRTRRQFGESDRFTLAGRLRVAATAGSALRALPVNKRVFSGGGASVRGYDFQSVGPLDADGVPIGGRSAVETALEARAKVIGPLQLAAFTDAGAVFSESFPDFVGDYLIGAGGGVRYLSPIGPIRLDVALPLEKRPTDRDLQFYISLGQPF